MIGRLQEPAITVVGVAAAAVGDPQSGTYESVVLGE